MVSSENFWKKSENCQSRFRDKMTGCKWSGKSPDLFKILSKSIKIKILFRYSQKKVFRYRYLNKSANRLSESKPSGIRPLVKLPAKLYLHILIPSDIHTCRSEYLQNRIPAKLNAFSPESLQTRIPAELNTCRIEYLLTWMPAAANTCKKWIPAVGWSLILKSWRFDWSFLS